MSGNTWLPSAAQTPMGRDLLAFLKDAKPMPSNIEPNVNGLSWARSLFMGEKYVEPKPGMMSSLALANAMDEEDVFAMPSQPTVVSLADWLPDEVGASTGAIVATDIYVLPSTQQTGPPTYVYVTVHHVQSGGEITYNTSSKTIQAFYLKLLVKGKFDTPHQIKRVDEQVKGGKHMFGIFPPD